MAPGRVNLIGEHTDYNEGYVLPLAIDRAALVLAGPAGGTRSVLWAPDLDRDGDEAVVRVDLRETLRPASQLFANYLLGVVDQFARSDRPVSNMNLLVEATVPVGAGLSSSAAVEVAMATVLEQPDDPLDPVEKARLCQRAEHAFPGTPCGIMDMLTAVTGRAGHALLIDCRSLDVRHVALPDAGHLAILVADTAVAHELAVSAYADRRAACDRVATRLGRGSLRDASRAEIESAGLARSDRRRALHVVDENARVLAAVDALEQGDLVTLGRLLFEGHASMRDLFEASSHEQDTLVEAAAELAPDQVYGARLTGGGFGGSCVVLARPEALDAVREHLGRRFLAAHGREPTVFAVRASGSARHLDLSRE
jgi:galactokinase